MYTCRLVVVLYSKTYIFNFLDLTLIDCLDTCDNALGICEIAIANTRHIPGEDDLMDQAQQLGYSAQNRKCTVMASLALQKGHVRLRKMLDNSNEYVVPCHNEHITALRFSESGEYLATVCEQGLYIRLWKWSEVNGQMEPPVSLYMFEINAKNGSGYVYDIRMTKSLNCIAALINIQCKTSSNQTSAQ